MSSFERDEHGFAKNILRQHHDHHPPFPSCVRQTVSGRSWHGGSAKVSNAHSICGPSVRADSSVLTLTVFEKPKIWIHRDGLREYKMGSRPHPSVSALIIEPSTVSSTSQSLHFFLYSCLTHTFAIQPPHSFEPFNFYQLQSQPPSK